MKRLLLAALIALAPSLAAAGEPMAVIAPTVASPTDSSNRIATTAWVNSWAGSAIPLANGKIWIGSAGGIATPQTMSGDATLSTAGALTLATVNANVGSFGSATQCVTFTTNGKGLITAASATTCTPGIASVTGLGTGVATALGVNVGSAGAPVLFNGAGGTPSSLTLTNATGLPTTGLTGTLQAAQEPAHTGGCTNSAGSLALSCTINTNMAMGYGGNCGAAGTNTTVYFGPTGCEAAAEANVQTPVSSAFTAKNLYAATAAAPGGAQTFIFTLRKNGADTTLTCTISASATSCNDTTHTVSFAAGDLISMKEVISATATSTLANTMLTAVTTSP